MTGKVRHRASGVWCVLEQQNLRGLFHLFVFLLLYAHDDGHDDDHDDDCCDGRPAPRGIEYCGGFQQPGQRDFRSVANLS